LQVVIAQFVPRVAVFQQDDLVERARAPGEVTRCARMLADIASDQPQMVAIACQIDPRPFERGQRQRRLSNRPIALTRSTELAQKPLACLRIEGFGRLVHSTIRVFVPRPGSSVPPPERPGSNRLKVAVPRSGP